MKITFLIEDKEICVAIDAVANNASTPSAEHDAQILKLAIDEIKEVNIKPGFFDGSSKRKKELKSLILATFISELAKNWNDVVHNLLTK